MRRSTIGLEKYGRRAATTTAAPDRGAVGTDEQPDSIIGAHGDRAFLTAGSDPTEPEPKDPETLGADHVIPAAPLVTEESTRQATGALSPVPLVVAEQSSAQATTSSASAAPSLDEAIDDTMDIPLDNTYFSLAVSPDGRQIYVPRPGAVDIYDANTNSKIRTIEIEGFHGSGEAEVTADGKRLLISGTSTESWNAVGSAAVAIVNLEDGTFKVMTPFPNDYGIPASIAVSSDGKTLYGTSIATGSPHIGYIYKIDVDTGTVLATAAVGRVAAWRWDLVISPNGDRIYAEGQLEGGGRQVVRAIDAETLEVVSEVVTTGHQHEGHLAISSDGSRIYTLGYAPGDASGSRIVLSIIEVSGDTLTLAATRTLGPWHARALAGINVSPDDSRVYVFTQSEDSPRASDLYVLDSRDAHTIHHGTLSVGAISWAVGQTVLSDAGRFLHVRVQLHTDDDVAAAQVITFDTTKLRDAGGGGTTDDTQGALRASINMSVGWIPVVGTVFNAFNLVSDFFAFTIALIQGNTADMTRVINSMALDLVGLIPIIGGPLAATLYWNSLPAGSAPTTTATDTNL